METEVTIKSVNVDGCARRPSFLFVHNEFCTMAEKRKAFSFVEAIIVVLFIGILAAVAVPRFNFALISKHKAETTAKKIVTDLRRIRNLAITNAATNPLGFSLRLNPPIPYTAYEIVDYTPPLTVVDTHPIESDVSISCLGIPCFKFGALGNLTVDSGTELAVSAEGKTFTITIVRATGMIKCTEN